MPVAGSGSVQRAKAHARWADRYARAGNLKKASAHFGRALDYVAPSFGAGAKRMHGDDDSDEEDPREPFLFDYPDPVWDTYNDSLFRAAAAFPKHRGSLEINYKRELRDKELADLERRCKRGDTEMCEKQAAFKRLLAQRKAIADDEERRFTQARYAESVESSRSGSAAAATLRESPDKRKLSIDMDEFQLKMNPKDIQLEYYKHVLDEHEKDRVRRVVQRTDPTTLSNEDTQRLGYEVAI